MSFPRGGVIGRGLGMGMVPVGMRGLGAADERHGTVHHTGYEQAGDQMALLSPGTRLKKELGLWDVYAVATGATLSSGFFLLPGIAAVGAGPAVPVSYLIAGLLLIPGLVSKAELATAMPRAGGVYYFLDRSMGPLFGTMGGFGTWFALVLKSAFALVGVGAYLRIFFPNAPLVPVAAGFAILFGALNLLGARKSSSFQVFLLVGLLLLLLWFSGFGLFRVEAQHFDGFFAAGGSSIVTTAGLVIVSYMGLTKVASVAEEVKNPERNLPLGMFLAFGTAILIYTVGTSVMVGVVSAETLARDGGDLTPVATVADALAGRWGAVIMTIGAVLAFSSVANAGILSASRYPLAMGRDNLVPAVFKKVGSRGTPTNAIYITVALILAFVILFDPTGIAKLASSFKLVMFAMSCMAVIVMRESGIASYDPAYRFPFYPWLHWLGVLAPFWLIVQMGFLATLFTGGLLTFGAVWYSYYARKRVVREGAILHVFERLGRRRYEELDVELRQIMKEKGLRKADPFDEVVAQAFVMEAPSDAGFRELVWEASARLADALDVSATDLGRGFLEGTTVGVTPVSHGAALPHVRLPGIGRPHLVLVRCRGGILLEGMEVQEPRSHEPIHAVFFLASPDDDPGLHLRLLAQIAGRVDDEGFMAEWLSARNDQELKEALLREERLCRVRVSSGTRSEEWIGLTLRELELPEGTLIALIRRGDEALVPGGDTILEDGDRLTAIGDPAAIRKLRHRYRP
jgi:amino acid transporter/mannitol/fructose-specific phosphotransferase system IIA component (Ntr-type)